MNSPTQQRGNKAEQRALRHLKKHGLKLVEQQYQCRFGEIDLIMLDQSVYVFVEVRYRHNQSHGTATETITPAKQRKLIKTAQHFLSRHQLHDRVTCRFDCMGITRHDITWSRAAFDTSAVLFG